MVDEIRLYLGDPALRNLPENVRNEILRLRHFKQTGYRPLGLGRDLRRVKAVYEVTLEHCKELGKKHSYPNQFYQTIVNCIAAELKNTSNLDRVTKNLSSKPSNLSKLGFLSFLKEKNLQVIAAGAAEKIFKEKKR